MSTGSTKIKSSYADILSTDNSNDGLSTATKTIKTLKGNNTALGLSTIKALIKPASDGTTTFEVQDKDANTLFVVDSTNNRVKALGNDLNTGVKEFSLFDFSPTAGVHNPMICNPVMSGGDAVMVEDTSAFSNGANPALTLDLSADGTPKTMVACMWFVPYDLTVTQVRAIVTADGNQSMKLNVYSYDLDTSTNHGDLSNGSRVAYTGSISATSTTVKTSVATLDNVNISASKVLIAFCEAETDTSDITANLILKYYLT